MISPRHQLAPPPYAFLASPFGLFECLRKRVHKLSRRVWVAECSDPDLGRFNPAVEDTCLQKIREAKLFLCVLDGRYGTFEAYRGVAAARVSLIELEVFQALIHRKPFFLFTITKFDWDPRLRSLISIVRSSGRVVHFECRSEQEVFKKVRWVLYTPRLGLRVAGFFLNLRSSGRRPRRRRDPLPPSSEAGVRFLNEEFEVHSDVCDTDVVNAALKEARITDGLARKLALLWIAVRHLCGAPYNQARFRDLLPLWDEVLSEWARASAWYGLHGNFSIGRLAAVNSLLDIRERIRAAGLPATGRQSIHGTRGALASEYYSMAKRTLRPHRRRALLTRALLELERALKEAPSDPAGLLAIRGSVLLSLGHTDAALRHYEEVLRLRRKQGSGPRALGEAMAELGHGYARAWRLAEARTHLEQGVLLLKESGNIPFTIRAMRKLAVFRMRSLRLKQAICEMREACRLARKQNIYGQIDGLMGLLCRILDLFPPHPSQNSARSGMIE